MTYKTFTILFLHTISTAAFSQAVDNTASFRMIAADRYMRFHYENDFFSSNDEYYTQGMNLELVTPGLKINPLNRLLFVSKQNINQFGMAIEHNAYTPTSITSDKILFDDRPFAATLMLKTFVMSNHYDKRYRLSSSLLLGMIGKVAGAYEIQRDIHRWTNGTKPHGWKNQIKNDIMINYEIVLEKNIAHSNFFLINTYTALRVGTLSTKFFVGTNILIGKLNTSIKSVLLNNESEIKQKFTFHIFVQPLVNAVLYDATMQGGLIVNPDSPYTLSFKEVNHFTFQGNTGIVLSFGRINLEYFQTILSKEFKAGHVHHWGSLRLGVAL